MRHVGYIENFAAGLIGDLANVDQAGNHCGGHESSRRIVPWNFEVVEDTVGRDGFGDDVVGALPTRVGAHVIANENDDAATPGRKIEEILGGEKDAVIDVGGAPDLERIDLSGDFGFVFGEGDAQFGFGGEGEKSNLVLWLEGGKCGGGSFAQRDQEWADGIAQIEDESNVKRELVAAEDLNFLRNSILAELEVFLFQVGHDLACLGFDGGIYHDEVDVDMDDTPGLILRQRGKGERQGEDKNSSAVAPS